MAITPMNALFHQATTRPDGTAFIYNGAVWTYRNLLAGAEQLSRAFLAHGVRPGDRVILHMPNRPEMAVALSRVFAPERSRARRTCGSSSRTARDLSALQPALYLGEEQLYSHVETIEREILAAEKRFVAGPSAPTKAQCLGRRCSSIASGTGRPPEPDKGAPALLLTTSGTSGQPKFVTHTSATLSAIAEACAHLDLSAAQIVLNACPMVHASGLFTLQASVDSAPPWSWSSASIRKSCWTRSNCMDALGCPACRSCTTPSWSVSGSGRGTSARSGTACAEGMFVPSSCRSTSRRPSARRCATSGPRPRRVARSVLACSLGLSLGLRRTPDSPGRR